MNLNTCLRLLCLCYLLTPGAVFAAMMVCAGEQPWAAAVFAYDALLGFTLVASWRATRSRWLALCVPIFGLHLLQAVVMLTPWGLQKSVPAEGIPLLICIPWMAFLTGMAFSQALHSRALQLLAWMQLLASLSFWQLQPENVFSHMEWYWLLFGIQGLQLWRARPQSEAASHLGLTPQGVGGSL